MTRITRRQFALAGSAAVMTVNAHSPAMAVAATIPAAAVDPLSLVDAELRPALQTFLQSGGFGPVADWSATDGLARIRRISVMPQTTPLAAPAYSERLIPGPKGAPEVRVFIVNASGAGPIRPALLHMHGGGYVLGTASRSVRALQRVALTHDCVCLSVDYRLAPETPFPGALEDNYAALRWLHEHAAELGVDRSRIAIMGESAGGGHAATLAITARDRGEVRLVLQILIYPMLDDRTGSSRRVPPYIGAYVWTAEENRFGWSSLLGLPAGSTAVPANAVPARARNVHGLAPAFIGVGSIDLFVEEDLAYAQRLIAAGVPTQVFVAPGAYHAFAGLAPEAAVSKEFTSAWNAALQRAFVQGTSA